MEIGISLLDDGMGYVSQGLDFVRDILNKIASWIPIGEPELIVAIVFLLASLLLGRLIVKRLVIRPFSFPYIIWTIIISISIFLNLMYL